MGKILQLKPGPRSRAAAIDEFGDIVKLRKAFLPTEQRYQTLLREIAPWYAKSAAAKEFVASGERWQLNVSMCQRQSSIDIWAVYKLLGLTKFLKICSVTLKAIGEFLTQSQIDGLTSHERTGRRDYVPTLILAPPAEPAVAPIDLVAV
jgi:hypothetical protein